MGCSGVSYRFLELGLDGRAIDVRHNYFRHAWMKAVGEGLPPPLQYLQL